MSLIPQSEYLKGKRRILPGEIRANGVFSGATQARLASPRGAPVTSWLHGTFQTRATSPSSCSRLTWGPQSCVKAGPTHLRMQCSGEPAGGAGLGACVCGLPSSGWWVSLAPSPHPAPGSRWCVCVSEFSHLGCTYGLISRPRVWAPFVSGFSRHPWNLEETRCKTPKEN